MTSRNQLPPVPHAWHDRYRQIGTSGFDAWLDESLWSSHVEAEWLDKPERLLDEAVVAWYKQGRNLLAEVTWPEAGDDALPKTVVLKQYGSSDGRLDLRALLRSGRAVKAWNNAFELLERGIMTPRPLWLALPRSGKRGAPSFQAVEKAPDHTLLRDALRQVRKGRESIRLADGFSLATEEFLAEIAAFVRAMHDAGVWHRDFSGGNLLIPNGWRPDNAKEKGSHPPFILIDINRCRFFEPGTIPTSCRLRDLERVSLPENAREAFFAAYAQGAPAVLDLRERYFLAAKRYRQLRDTHNPLLRFWRKVFTYWLRNR